MTPTNATHAAGSPGTCATTQRVAHERERVPVPEPEFRPTPNVAFVALGTIDVHSHTDRDAYLCGTTGDGAGDAAAARAVAANCAT